MQRGFCLGLLAKVERFNQTNGEIVQTGASAHEFELPIAAMLSDCAQAHTDLLVAIARTNRWALRLDQVSTLVDDVLARQTSPKTCAASQAN